MATPSATEKPSGIDKAEPVKQRVMSHEPTPVQDWPSHLNNIVYPDTRPTSIFRRTPRHVILPQHLAEILHAALWLHVRLNPQHANLIVVNAFCSWAWNLTPNGELKHTLSLTPDERQHWHWLMNAEARGVYHNLPKRPADAPLEAGEREKRARATNEDMPSKDPQVPEVARNSGAEPASKLAEASKEIGSVSCRTFEVGV